ncbi:hypothetical protein Tco_0942880, partial [Tanacetum coccineum]
IAENDLVVKKFPENDLVVKKFPENDFEVVEHVYHRDVAESDPVVIRGSSSSPVTLSVGLSNVEHTDLSTNDPATEAAPVNDDNANANEGKDNEDDVAAHVLDDDDVVVSDDDEVNPST